MMWKLSARLQKAFERQSEWQNGIARQVMNLQYDCADCRTTFSISVTDDEMKTVLADTHSEGCPNCGQKVGQGHVTCRQCGESFVVDLYHWHVLCDLAGGDCPQCGGRYESLCIC